MEPTDPTKVEASYGNDDTFDSKFPKRNRVDSSFMESMKFINVQPICHCDECCSDNNTKRKAVQIPETIRQALHNHKRMKHTEMPVKRSQVRTLVGRHRFGVGSEDIEIWEWTMPPLAEPIAEFGNPMIYRIIWIKRLHDRLDIKLIGSGIVGSKSEEQRRKQLDWREDDVILTISEGQKAVGYVVEPNKNVTVDGEDALNLATLTGPAILYVAKIPAELVQNDALLSIRDDKKLLDSKSMKVDTNSRVIFFEIMRRICSRTVLAASNDPELKQNVFPMDRDDQNLFRRSVAMLNNK
jgi:hypothetical protein